MSRDLTEDWMRDNNIPLSNRDDGYYGGAADNSRCRQYNLSLDDVYTAVSSPDVDVYDVIEHCVLLLTDDEQRIYNNYRSAASDLHAERSEATTKVLNKLLELCQQQPAVLFSEQPTNNKFVVNQPFVMAGLETARQKLEEFYHCSTFILGTDCRDNNIRVQVVIPNGNKYRLSEKQVVELADTGKCKLNKAQSRKLRILELL